MAVAPPPWSRGAPLLVADLVIIAVGCMLIVVAAERRPYIRFIPGEEGLPFVSVPVHNPAR